MLNMEPDLAGKITGMLLEMSEGDVIAIIEDHVACQDKVCSICGPVAVAIVLSCLLDMLMGMLHQSPSCGLSYPRHFACQVCSV